MLQFLQHYSLVALLPYRCVYELESVAIASARHCEAARRRASPYPLHNYDAHAKFEVAEVGRTYPLPFYSVFAADTLRYAMTLTSSPVAFTFDLRLFLAAVSTTVSGVSSLT